MWRTKFGFKRLLKPFPVASTIRANIQSLNISEVRGRADLLQEAYLRSWAAKSVCLVEGWCTVCRSGVVPPGLGWAGLGWCRLLAAFFGHRLSVCVLAASSRLPAEWGEKSAILCKILESWLYQTFSASLQLKSNCSFCYFLASGLLELETPSFHNPSIVTMIRDLQLPSPVLSIQVYMWARAVNEAFQSFHRVYR